ncbi:hypothetical protein L873DRAFT_1841322 [Choiromyces venosus 120613-1]|uniref:Uncharacterized protein n=1 Tax=Choiromyces venosus 120613-1 TaxID=1336337 RepID=A0A3N4K4K6_9PEZI|nr:hypothetical protein L873DRAFT_1841322 [Choiromyces venosus 120613-1]
MWDTIRAMPKRYFSRSSMKPSGLRSESQSTLAVYSEFLSQKKAAPTALEIPTQKPIFIHSELLQSIKEGISRVNLPQDPAGMNKENHPALMLRQDPRIPILTYLDEKSKPVDATTGNPVVARMASRFSDSYNEYISNARSEYEAGDPGEVSHTQKKDKNSDVVRAHPVKRSLKPEPSLPTVWEANPGIPLHSQPIPIPGTASGSSASYRLHRAHQSLDSASLQIGSSQRVQYLKQKAQLRRSEGEKESPTKLFNTIRSPRKYSSQSFNYEFLPRNPPAPTYQQAPASPPPAPIRTPPVIPHQEAHPGQRILLLGPDPGEEEEPLMTMAQKIARGREKVIALCGLPNPPLTRMPTSPRHLNMPDPSTIALPPSPLIRGPAQAVPTPPATTVTFKVPRKPLPPSAVPNQWKPITLVESFHSLTKEDFKISEEPAKKSESPPAPPSRPHSSLSMRSIISSISRRSIPSSLTLLNSSARGSIQSFYQDRVRGSRPGSEVFSKLDE